jgi:general secretion pathway protein M
MALSAGFQRTLAVALLALLLALVWRAALRPAWQQWTIGAQQIEQQRSTIGRLRAMAGARDQYARALAEVRSRSGVDSALMKSASVTLAAAQLQQDVKSMVERAGGSLVSSQPRDAPGEGPFARVQLSVRMLVSIVALQQVMHALESQRPIVIIDEVLILSRARRKSRTNDTLDVRMSIAGFVARAQKGGDA